MINNIRFKIIVGKMNKISEFYTIFAQKMPNYIIRQRDRGQAEAVCLKPKLRGRGQGRGKSFRPRPKFWPRGLKITPDM